MNERLRKWLTFKWLEDNLVDVVKWRYVLAVMGIVEALLFSGLVFGWANLVFILKSDGFWIELCPELNATFQLRNTQPSVNQSCTPQDEMLHAVFAVAAFVPNAVLVLIGFSIDRFGPRNMRFVASLLLMCSFLMFAFANRETASLLFPALSICSTAGMYFLLSLFQIGNLFKTKRSTIISIINGSFDASAAIFLIFQLVYNLGMSRQNLFIIWAALTLITVIDTIVLIPAKPILPPDTEYNSITSGILGNYYYVFHALEVVNVSLLGLHSKTITHMRKPSQAVNRRNKIFDSVSISYDMTETSKDEMPENDQLKRGNSFLSVNHSINLNESNTVEMKKEDSDPSIINCEIVEPKNINNETVANNSHVQGLNLPIINIQSPDEAISNRQYVQSKDQNGFFTLDRLRQTRRSLSLDADPLYLVDQNDILNRIRSVEQTTDNNNSDCEMDSFVTGDRCSTSPNKGFNTSSDGDEENIDAVSIHSQTIDSFEHQAYTDCSIKDTNDQRSLPPSPTGSASSAGSSVSAYDLNALFFENNFTDYAKHELPVTADQHSQVDSIQSPVQNVGVTITNIEDCNHVDTDYDDGGKIDNESVSSVVLANKFFTASINHKAIPLDTMNNAGCRRLGRSCPQSPTGSITSICSNGSGYNLTSLFSDINAITKHKKMTVDDGVLYNSTSNCNQVMYRTRLRGKKKSKTQPSSPTGSVSSACSSISAYHLKSLFDNDKFRQQLSNLEVDKKMITEWIANQQQYSHLCQQQSDDIEPTTTTNSKDCFDTNNYYSTDNDDRCQELINASQSDKSNRWNPQAMIATTEISCIAVKDDIDTNETKSNILNSDTAYNPSHESAKSNILHSDVVLNPLPSHLDPKDEVNYSPYQIRKTTISTIAEEYDSYEIPDMTVTITNREEDIKVKSSEGNECQAEEVDLVPRSNILAQLLRQGSKESNKRRSYIPTRRDSNFASNDIELPQLRLPRCMTDSKANYYRSNIYSLGNAFAVPATHTARLRTISEANRKREIRQRARRLHSDSVKSLSDTNTTIKIYREPSQKRKSTRRIRSDSSLSAKSEYMIDWKVAIRSPLFICHCLYLSFIQLRLVFFIGSLHSYLTNLADNNAAVVTTYTNAFGWVQMFGMIASVAIGLLMDLKLSETNPVEVVQMTSSAIAYLVINTITVLFGIVTVIPILQLQYISFLFHTIIRAFIYSANSSFIAIAFPIEHHSTLIAISLFVSGVCSLLQFPLFVLIKVTLGGDPFWINITLFLITIIAYGYPFLIWHESRKLEQAMRELEDEDEISTKAMQIVNNDNEDVIA